MKKRGPCNYNLAIDCDGGDCSRCGWCPSVEERGLSSFLGSDALTAEKVNKVYKTVDVYDETTERTVGTLSWPVFIHKEDAYA